MTLSDEQKIAIIRALRKKAEDGEIGPLHVDQDHIRERVIITVCRGRQAEKIETLRRISWHEARGMMAPWSGTRVLEFRRIDLRSGLVRPIGKR